MIGPFAPIIAGFGGATIIAEGGQKAIAYDAKSSMERNGTAHKVEPKGTIFERVKRRLFPSSGTVYTGRSTALATA